MDFLKPLDMGQNEILQLVLENLSSAPISPVDGQVYYDTTLESVRIYANGTWIAVGANGAAGVGLFSERPAAGTAGALFYATDTDILYVDNGSSWDTSMVLTNAKEPVRAATTANITLSAPQTIDGVSVVAGDRVLVKNQSTASQNGIYVVAAGSWTRASDANTSSLISGAVVSVQAGSTNGSDVFTTNFTSGSILGSTSMSWYRFLTTEGIAASDITSGTLSVARGGTGRSTLTSNSLIVGNGTSAVTMLTAGTAGKILRVVGSAPAWDDQQGQTTGTTLALTDIGNTIYLAGSNLGVTTLTIPPNSSVNFPVGTRFLVHIVNTKNTTTGGVVLISPGTGVTLNGATSTDITMNWDGSGFLTQIATDYWVFESFGPPVGTVQLYGGLQSDIPAGYLLCDGSAVSRTTYYRLFQVIGTRYGTGNGSTTFNLPSQSDKILKAISTSSDTPGNTHATGNNSAAHTHTVAITSGNNSVNHTHTTLVNYGNAGAANKTSGVESANHTHSVSGNTGNNSGDHTHSFNVVAFNLIIRAW